MSVVKQSSEQVVFHFLGARLRHFLRLCMPCFFLLLPLAMGLGCSSPCPDCSSLELTFPEVSLSPQEKAIGGVKVALLKSGGFLNMRIEKSDGKLWKFESSKLKRVDGNLSLWSFHSDANSSNGIVGYIEGSVSKDKDVIEARAFFLAYPLSTGQASTLLSSGLVIPLFFKPGLANAEKPSSPIKINIGGTFGYEGKESFICVKSFTLLEIKLSLKKTYRETIGWDSCG